MIYGNTGAGLVDINVPQNPLYQQSLPNLKQVSANAWGLPSLDDITVPDVTAEKDVQTDTGVTDKYFELAQKLKDYAIKGRAVGIDVTKPKNNPEHMKFAQEWNSMYSDFMQLGKELKRGKENQVQMNKLVSNPNAITADLPRGEVVTDDILAKYSMAEPLAEIKPVIKGYQSLRIYDQPSYDKFFTKWKTDIQKIDNATEKSIALHPELAEQIQDKADEAKMAMFPPNIDPRFGAKLDQDMQKFNLSLAHKKSVLGFMRQKEQNRIESEKMVTGQYGAQVADLMNTDNGESYDFGEIVVNPNSGSTTIVPHKVERILGKDAVGRISNVAGALKDDDILFKVTDGSGNVKTYNMSNEAQSKQFESVYAPAYSKKEEMVKASQPTYDYTIDENGDYVVVPNSSVAGVSKKVKSSNTTTKTNTQKKKVSNQFKGVPPQGF